MQLSHKIKKTKITRDVSNTLERNLCAFLVNRRGHYFSISADQKDQITNFNGWFNVIPSPEGYTLYKSIDNIYLNKQPTEIINDFTDIERRSSESIERFTIAKNGLIYEVLSYHGFINLSLDFRQTYDTDDKGRVYSIYRIENTDVLIVEYTKYTDDSKKTVDKKYYMAIKGITGNYEIVNNWSKKYYNYDAYRKNKAEYYIYDALKILCKKNMKIFFGFSEDKDEAISKANDIFENSGKIDEDYTKYMDNVLVPKHNISDASGELAAFAYASSIHAIENLSMNLQVDHKKLSGLWAGLPWFHQYWARDELISMYSLLLEHRYEYGKELLLRHLSEIKSDGRLPNRYPSADLGNADGIGWLFKRLYDFLILCEQRDNFDSYFTLYDLKYIRERLSFSIKMLLKNHSKDGLITNDKLETWMDTFVMGAAYDKDYREGTRIEIQTLFLNMLKLMNLLDNYLTNKFVKKNDKLIRVAPNDMHFKKLEEETCKLVRDKFLKNVNGKSVLNDGYDCGMHEVVRPNIFLAYYIYPELLAPSEWEQVFDNALPKLWCDWNLGKDSDGKELHGGGFSTIDKSHYLYQSNYTGIDNRSYHRGDSWFWINNMAAICMYRLDKEKYKQYIDKIMCASVEDMLFNGYLGYSSELSSSSWLKSGGCLCQTWSIATFIEMMHEFYIE